MEERLNIRCICETNDQVHGYSGKLCKTCDVFIMGEKSERFLNGCYVKEH